MGKTVQSIVSGLIFVLVAAVVFVKAGQKSGESGGSQAAKIIGSTGDSFANVLTAATGG